MSKPLRVKACKFDNVERFFFYPITHNNIALFELVSCMAYISDPCKMAQWNLRKLPHSTDFFVRFLSNGFSSKLNSGWLFSGVKSDVYTQFCYMDLYMRTVKKKYRGRLPGSLSAIVYWNVKKTQLITAHPVIEWLSWAVVRFVRIPINQRILFKWNVTPTVDYCSPINRNPGGDPSQGACHQWKCFCWNA